MPIGDPMGYFKKGRKAVRSGSSSFSKTRAAHGMFAAIGSIGRSSGGRTPAQLARSGKIRSAAVASGVVGMGAMGGRRGSGTGRSTGGRPTGIRRY